MSLGGVFCDHPIHRGHSTELFGLPTLSAGGTNIKDFPQTSLFIPCQKTDAVTINCMIFHPTLFFVLQVLLF